MCTCETAASSTTTTTDNINYCKMLSVHATSDSNEFCVTRDVRRDFALNGYVLVRGMFSAAEVSALRSAAETMTAEAGKGDDGAGAATYAREDGSGRAANLCLWTRVRDDATGRVARSRKVAGTVQSLLGGDEIYHYHTKVILKEARTGGAFEWHQDYGYWYRNDCILPEMASVFIPIDKCTRENGCLRVLRGSHRMGRVDHATVGQQAAADPARLELAERAFPLEHLEMDCGDALFFHCNLLHSSARNDSDLRRCAMVVAYNKALNSPPAEQEINQKRLLFGNYFFLEQ